MQHEAGYMQIQSTKPQTLGYALEDSPAGVGAWIVEKFRAWSDCDGDVESSFTRDQLLTNVMLYWLTGTAHSSARLYYENRQSGNFAIGGHVDVPTGAAIFPREIIRPPRNWVEYHYNLTHWSEMPRGGHFAAMEEPELFVDDVRAFFRTCETRRRWGGDMGVRRVVTGIDGGSVDLPVRWRRVRRRRVGRVWLTDPRPGPCRRCRPAGDGVLEPAGGWHDLFASSTCRPARRCESMARDHRGHRVRRFTTQTVDYVMVLEGGIALDSTPARCS